MELVRILRFDDSLVTTGKSLGISMTISSLWETCQYDISGLQKKTLRL